MANFLSKKLIELNLGRRNKLAVLANYVPFYIYENLLFISGQLPIENDQLKFHGKIDTDINTNEQSESIVLTTTNLLWTVSDAIDNSQNKIKEIKCINLKGYLNTSQSFKNHSILFNLASDLIINVLGKKNGNHSRSVIGVNSLPKESPIEIDAIFGIKY